MRHLTHAALAALAVWLGVSAESLAQCSARTRLQVDVAVNPPPSEHYGCWHPIKDSGNYWRLYSYVVHGKLHRHYLLWFPETPGRCYCYNPQKKIYWGHWTGFGSAATFAPAVQKSKTVRKTEFSQEVTVSPPAPGGSFPMTPPALPPDA